MVLTPFMWSMTLSINVMWCYVTLYLVAAQTMLLLHKERTDLLSFELHTTLELWNVVTDLVPQTNQSNSSWACVPPTHLTTGFTTLCSLACIYNSTTRVRCKRLTTFPLNVTWFSPPDMFWGERLGPRIRLVCYGTLITYVGPTPCSCKSCL